MSQQLGRILTCDRCGETVFESWHNPWTDKEDNRDMYSRIHVLSFEYTDGWISRSHFDLDERTYCYNNSSETLCPECEATRKDVMSKFWSNE